VLSATLQDRFHVSIVIESSQNTAPQLTKSTITMMASRMAQNYIAPAHPEINFTTNQLGIFPDLNRTDTAFDECVICGTTNDKNLHRGHIAVYK